MNNSKTTDNPTSMLAAALDYAGRGWYVFPAPPGEKKSYKSAEYSGGRNWGKTRDRAEIERDWKRWPDANVAIATGTESGIFVVEVDTPKGHDVDGSTALTELERQHGPLPPTLMGMSPSGSIHRFYKWPGNGVVVVNSASKLGPGIDVRGEGGMVIAPPSVRKDGSYRWLNDLPIAEAPQWLIEACSDRSRKSRSGDDEPSHEADLLDRVTFALNVVDANCSYKIWHEIGGALHHTLGEFGFTLFDKWSATAPEIYDRDECRERWNGCRTLTEFRVGTIFHYADQADPQWRARYTVEAEFGEFIRAHKAEAENRQQRRQLIMAKPFVLRDPTTIAERQWLYGHHLIRKFAAATIAHGGIGKSSLMLAEALAMATGRPLLGITPLRRVRVWYWNGEDPYEELERRIGAACLHCGIAKADLDGWLFVNSGREAGSEIVLATETREGAVIAAPVVDALMATIRENRIDVLQIDPFISSHKVSENDNNAIDVVAKEWTRLADLADVGIDLAHHSRKTGGAEVTVEDGRGAVALINAVRSARVLNTMTVEEAKKAGGGLKRHDYFKLANGKLNLAPRPERADWFHKLSVSLGNGLAGGDNVGVVTAWQWPEPADLSAEDFQKVAAKIRSGAWRRNVQADDWVGKAVAKALGLDLGQDDERAKVNGLVKLWIEERRLVVVDRYDSRARRDKEFVEVPG